MTPRRLLLTLSLAAAGCGAATPEVRQLKYPSGSPQWEYQVRDGLPDGPSETWYPDGSVQSQGRYVNGVRHGIFRFYTDGGGFSHQVLYWRGAEAWSSTDPDATPAPELVTKLEASSRGPIQLQEPPRSPFHFATEPDPGPYFVDLDRITRKSQVGLQFGVGDVTPVQVFGNYTFGHYGVYGQVSDAILEGAMDTAEGRRTFEVGGARFLSLDVLGDLALHAGVLVPIGSDSNGGYAASAASSMVWPNDAVTSFPSSAALRFGGTLVHRERYLVMQADLGIDWLLGGQESRMDALLRGNAGVGVGIRSAVVGVELGQQRRARRRSRRGHLVRPRCQRRVSGPAARVRRRPMERSGDDRHGRAVTDEAARAQRRRSRS